MKNCANLNNATTTVMVGEYFSIKAIWSHSRGTKKFPAVMTIDGRYSITKPRIPGFSLLFCLAEKSNTSTLPGTHLY